MASFGKDSMVVIDLASELGVRDVLHIQYADEPEDTDHVAKVVNRYGLNVTMIPQGRATFFFHKGEASLVVFTSIGVRFFPAPIAITKSADPGCLCVDDLLRGSAGPVNSLDPDLLIWGRRNADAVEHGASLRFLDDPRSMIESPPDWQVAGLRCVSPIVVWTPEEVWGYIEKRGVPVSNSSYADRRDLSGPASACWRCHDPSEEAIVDCPRGYRLMNLEYWKGKANGTPGIS
jgi:3'-phosphoadenosine 5'-phosphosulfate sulfotransferase (PAPS reductase)/FAD synthetase